jgi:positive regulator of sigma E activity
MENRQKESEAEIKASKAAVWSQLMEIGIDFAAYLAIPLLVFIYAGKWLDTRYNHHFFVIIGIFVALALSWYLIFKKIKAIKDLMDKK